MFLKKLSVVGSGWVRFVVLVTTNLNRCVSTATSQLHQLLSCFCVNWVDYSRGWLLVRIWIELFSSSKLAVRRTNANKTPSVAIEIETDVRTTTTMGNETSLVKGSRGRTRTVLSIRMRLVAYRTCASTEWNVQVDMYVQSFIRSLAFHFCLSFELLWTSIAHSLGTH